MCYFPRQTKFTLRKIQKNLENHFKIPFRISLKISKTNLANRAGHKHYIFQINSYKLNTKGLFRLELFIQEKLKLCLLF